MAHQRVSGVLWWRMQLSHYKAVFRRGTTDGYTKDFLQCPKELGYDIIPQLFGGVVLSPGEAYPPITYRWPGDSFEGGKMYHTQDRVEVGQWTGGTPHPWRIGDPQTDPLITLEGDPNASIPAGADAIWNNDLQPQQPWLVMVQLEGRQDELQLRAYLEDPPAHLTEASVDHLPPDLWDMMQRHQTSGVAFSLGGTAAPIRAQAVVNRVMEAFKEEPNVLLVGPPGTGKTVALEDLESTFALQSGLLFDPESFRDPWRQPGKPLVRSLVFHPSYTYEDFVAGLVPDADKQTGTLILRTRTGPLVIAAHYCSDQANEALLTLDEFNRGNTAAVFGDTLALLDRDKRSDPRVPDSGAFIERPYPDVSMQVPSAYAPSSGPDVPERLRLPKTVRLLAAMNSADRSVAPLDAALRRRFAVVRIEPDYDVLADNLAISLPADPWVDPGGSSDTWDVDALCGLAVALLRKLNRHVEFVLGQDFLLGHSLFWDVRSDDLAAVRAALARAMDHRVLPTLRAYLVDRDETLAAVLGAGAPEDSVPLALAPLVRWDVPPDTLAAVGASPRLVVEQAVSLSWADLSGALAHMAS